MRLIIYDVEVFAFDWIVVFKDVESGVHTVIHNDSEALRESPERHQSIIREKMFRYTPTKKKP